MPRNARRSNKFTTDSAQTRTRSAILFFAGKHGRRPEHVDVGAVTLRGSGRRLCLPSSRLVFEWERESSVVVAAGVCRSASRFDKLKAPSLPRGSGPRACRKAACRARDFGRHGGLPLRMAEGVSKLGRT